MKFSIKDFFSECDQMCSYLRIWSHLLKKSLTKNFIFCKVQPTEIVSMVFDMPCYLQNRVLSQTVNSVKYS